MRPGGPPIWIAGVVDAAVKRAARLGDAWLITNFAHLDDLERQMKIYRETLAEVGKPFPADAPITRECYIGPTRAQALEECKAALQYKYAAYSSWGLDKQSDGANLPAAVRGLRQGPLHHRRQAFVTDEIQPP